MSAPDNQVKSGRWRRLGWRRWIDLLAATLKRADLNHRRRPEPGPKKFEF